jgi:hypothetical protein
MDEVNAPARSVDEAITPTIEITRDASRQEVGKRVRIPQWRRKATTTAAWVLRRFDIGSAINRGFRYVEMLVITALVSVTVGIISPAFGLLISIVFSIAAGIYLVQPLTTYFTASLDRQVRSDKAARIIPPRRAAKSHLVRLLAIVVGGIGTLGLASVITPIVEATIQLDENRIRRTYQERARQDARCSALRENGQWEDGCPIPMPIL